MFQDTSLDFKLVQRICLLQQALDQAMDSLADLQQQVEDHQMLQSHLAQTEEYSNVQQKIIVNLQQQLEAKTQWQHQVLERVLVRVKYLIDDQQIELERLRARIYQSQAEVQSYLVRLKDYYQLLPESGTPQMGEELTSEVMIVRTLTVSLCGQLQAARQHVHQLDRTLTRYQVTFAQMKAQAQAVNASLDPVPELAAESGFDFDLTDLETLGDPVALKAIVDAQHQKITELSGELNKQFQQQTHLKLRCQELAAERDCSKQQVTELQLENESLRQQLAQAQLSSSLSEPLSSSPSPAPPRRPADSAIPQWQARSQETNPLFRFKPHPN
jgi:chromosome segregation ATPase